MAAVTFSRGGTSGGKKVKETGNAKKGEKRKRRWGYGKGNSRTDYESEVRITKFKTADPILRSRIQYFSEFWILLL